MRSRDRSRSRSRERSGRHSRHRSPSEERSSRRRRSRDREQDRDRCGGSSDGRGGRDDRQENRYRDDRRSYDDNRDRRGHTGDRPQRDDKYQDRRAAPPAAAPVVPSVADAAAVWGNPGTEEEDSKEPLAVVAKANFGVTGALAKDKVTGNVYNGVVLKWSEPQDAAGPNKSWRLYVFQGEKLVDTLHIHRQSAYLLGREEKVADIKLMNPSCSKQHAVIQFRRTPTVVKEATDVDEAVVKKTVKPYVMDLDSTNKTFLNGTEIEGSRYVELRAKDVLKFGESSKEYVLICE